MLVLGGREGPQNNMQTWQATTSSLKNTVWENESLWCYFETFTNRISRLSIISFCLQFLLCPPPLENQLYDRTHDVYICIFIDIAIYINFCTQISISTLLRRTQTVKQLRGKIHRNLMHAWFKIVDTLKECCLSPLPCVSIIHPSTTCLQKSGQCGRYIIHRRVLHAAGSKQRLQSPEHQWMSQITSTWCCLHWKRIWLLIFSKRHNLNREHIYAAKTFRELRHALPLVIWICNSLLSSVDENFSHAVAWIITCHEFLLIRQSPAILENQTLRSQWNSNTECDPARTTPTNKSSRSISVRVASNQNQEQDTKNWIR